MAIFDVEHLTWPFIFFPGVCVAALIAIDNKFRGPYFALPNAVFGDIDSGLSLLDMQIIRALGRRAIYLFGTGMFLKVLDYQNLDIVAVLSIGGFLVIWPTFFKPLPQYVKRSDWEVMCLYLLYIVSFPLFGVIGAATPRLVLAATRQTVPELMRDNLATLIVWAPIGVLALTMLFFIKKMLRNKIDQRATELGTELL
ncbi:MAG: hypothetical protein JST91_28150 [Actinobacteria bacterium]|nr:hypothetical protein [Actinomycetota bacterium]